MIKGSHTYSGHNPMGGWSVLAMILCLLVQTCSGLFAVDVDGIESGPLSYLVSFDMGRTLAHVHGWAFNALLGLIALHLIAVAFYCIYKREALVSAMIAGHKYLSSALTDEQVSFVSWWRFIAAVAAVALVVFLVASGFQI